MLTIGRVAAAETGPHSLPLTKHTREGAFLIHGDLPTPKFTKTIQHDAEDTLFLGQQPPLEAMLAV